MFGIIQSYLRRYRRFRRTTASHHRCLVRSHRRLKAERDRVGRIGHRPIARDTHPERTMEEHDKVIDGIESLTEPAMTGVQTEPGLSSGSPWSPLQLRERIVLAHRMRDDIALRRFTVFVVLGGAQHDPLSRYRSTISAMDSSSGIASPESAVESSICGNRLSHCHDPSPGVVRSSCSPLGVYRRSAWTHDGLLPAPLTAPAGPGYDVRLANVGREHCS